MLFSFIYITEIICTLFLFDVYLAILRTLWYFDTTLACFEHWLNKSRSVICFLQYPFQGGNRKEKKYLKKLISSFHAWNRSKEEEEEECIEKWELQLPQSHVSSYFSWFYPSASSLQLPTDDTAREAFRWPIGFVTSGFIHGRYCYSISLPIHTVV